MATTYLNLTYARGQKIHQAFPKIDIPKTAFNNGRGLDPQACLIPNELIHLICEQILLVKRIGIQDVINFRLACDRSSIFPNRPAETTVDVEGFARAEGFWVHLMRSLPHIPTREKSYMIASVELSFQIRLKEVVDKFLCDAKKKYYPERSDWLSLRRLFISQDPREYLIENRFNETFRYLILHRKMNIEHLLTRCIENNDFSLAKWLWKQAICSFTGCSQKEKKLLIATKLCIARRNWKLAPIVMQDIEEACDFQLDHMHDSILKYARSFPWRHPFQRKHDLITDDDTEKFVLEFRLKRVLRFLIKDCHRTLLGIGLEALKRNHADVAKWVFFEVSEEKYSLPHITAFKSKTLVELFLEEGADLNEKNEDGNTALHVAAYNGETEIVRLLLDRGADVTARGTLGITPLHAVAGCRRGGALPIAKLLICHGADKNALDKLNRYPIDLADDLSFRKEIAPVENILRASWREFCFRFFRLLTWIVRRIQGWEAPKPPAQEERHL